MKEDKYLKIAIDIIETYLNTNVTADGIYDIFEIKNDNKEVLLGHLVAIRNIMDKSINILKGENNE